MGCTSSVHHFKVPNEKRFRRAIKLYEVSEVASLTNPLNRNRCFESGESPLTLAAQEGHEAVVEVLIKNGADVNKLDKNGRGPLHIAVQMNDLETVDILLRSGADPNRCDHNNVLPACIAAERGYTGTLKKLLEANADPNGCNNLSSPPLMCAISRGHKQCVELLLLKGADVNVRDPSGETAVRMAVANGDAFSLGKLLENKSLNGKNDGLGALAALTGQPSILQQLIAAGSDVSSVSEVDKDIPPALVSATARQSFECVDILLNEGCDPNTSDRNEQSVLHIAIMSVVDKSKQVYFTKYFSNVYRLYSRYDPLEIVPENCIKCAISIVQAGADVSKVWIRFAQLFPNSDGITFEEMVMCEVLVQAYGFVDLSEHRLRCFVKNLLTIREFGLVKLIYSAGVDPSWEDHCVLAMSGDESDKVMFQYIKKFCSSVRTLKDTCRRTVRKLLSWNVLFNVNKLPRISEHLKDYICIMDTEFYSAIGVP